ncbi:hypothetical protein CCACVL1_07191 [Corchorus capsularis]|uniref:Uncharacterized protein n=1 Tax=Corchorus capsularis TaxID=210143 RepID=A0A1R3J8S9_COCAP|nr:hypothetical protein CCACVL1_07191 [Corchorus capsularis]
MALGGGVDKNEADPPVRVTDRQLVRFIPRSVTKTMVWRY